MTPPAGRKTTLAAGGGDTPNDNDTEKPPNPTGEDCGKRPEKDTSGNNPFFVEPVSDKPGDRYHNRQSQKHRRLRNADLGVCQAEVTPNVGRDHAENGAICLMEKIGKKEENQKFPLIVAVNGIAVKGPRHNTYPTEKTRARCAERAQARSNRVPPPEAL